MNQQLITEQVPMAYEVMLYQSDNGEWVATCREFLVADLSLSEALRGLGELLIEERKYIEPEVKP